MSIEQRINQYLNQFPKIKKYTKNIYQHIMYAISPKIKAEGKIDRISPNDLNHDYFFGYYDKSPEDSTGRYVLCLKANETWDNVAPSIPAEILLIDTEKEISDPNRFRTLAQTHAWNVQQGCMMQWLGPDFNKEIIYNDCRDKKLCSVILNVFTGKERVLKAPVYSVSKDGTFALTLDFLRLHRIRPGYGYSNFEDRTKGMKLPEANCIWKLDINNNDLIPLLTYSDFFNFQPRTEMIDAEHMVNHIMIAPNDKRFMVLHRWLKKNRKYTRLITINVDGTEAYNLSDDNMVSHCFWKNDKEILAYENKINEGVGYYLMMDKTNRYKRLWSDIAADGHPSYNSNNNLVVTDTYPNRSRMQTLYILTEKGDYHKIARVFAPFKYDNDTRCDLHPRWSRDGNKIYIDATFEGRRGLYTVKVE